MQGQAKPCIMHDVQTCTYAGGLRDYSGAQHSVNGQSYRAIVHRRSRNQSVAAARPGVRIIHAWARLGSLRLQCTTPAPVAPACPSGQPRICLPARQARTKPSSSSSAGEACLAGRSGLGHARAPRNPDKVLAVAEKIRLMIIFIIPLVTLTVLTGARSAVRRRGKCLLRSRARIHPSRRGLGCI